MGCSSNQEFPLIPPPIAVVRVLLLCGDSLCPQTAPIGLARWLSVANKQWSVWCPNMPFTLCSCHMRLATPAWVMKREPAMFLSIFLPPPHPQGGGVVICSLQDFCSHVIVTQEKLYYNLCPDCTLNYSLFAIFFMHFKSNLYNTNLI